MYALNVVKTEKIACVFDKLMVNKSITTWWSYENKGCQKMFYKILLFLPNQALFLLCKVSIKRTYQFWYNILRYKLNILLKSNSLEKENV